jgi:hypothetical protein
MPYSRSVSTGGTNSCDVTFEYSFFYFGAPHHKYHYVGASECGGGVETPLPSFPTDLDNRAVNDALKKLKNQDVNLATSFAERKQTIDTVADGAKTIANIVRAAKSKNPKAFERMAKAGKPSVLKKSKDLADKHAHDVWLQMKYGWDPTVADVYGAVKDLHDADALNSNRYMCTVKGHTRREDHLRRSFTAVFGSLYQEIAVADDVDFKVLVRLDYGLSNPILANLSQMGITNPVELAWEELPYSFVADWFLPIGDYLGNLDATLGWDFLGGTKTSTTTQRHRVDTLGTPYLGSGWPWFFTFQPGRALVKGRARRFDMNRSVYTMSPYPDNLFFKNPVSGVHLANALALLKQVF